MAMNIEQRLEQSAKSIEQSSQKAHDFAEKDTTIQTCAGSRDSLPKVSRIWQENFARQFNTHATEFQDRFAISQQSLPWQAGITISDSLQRYHVGVQGEEGYKEFLPNPLKLPFETAATLADDLSQARWLENGVPNKHWTESKVTSALEKSLGVNARIWPKSGNLKVGDVVPSAQETADGLPITHLVVDGNAYAMSPVASGLVADLTANGATIGGVVVTLDPLQKVYTPEMFGASAAVTLDNTAQLSEMFKSVPDGAVLDFGGKEYRVLAAVTGIPSASADPLTDNALQFSECIVLLEKKGITLRNGTIYAANQGVSATKMYFPSTVSFIKSEVHFDNFTIEGKGENWGDADASQPLTINQRLEFLATNGGHAAYFGRSKVTGKLTTRLCGSVAPMYFSSCPDVRMTDTFSNAASLGYAPYAFDAWVGQYTDLLVPKFYHELTNPHCYAEKLTRREDGAAVGSSVYSGKGGMVTEDRELYLVTHGGRIEDQYANGGGTFNKTLGYAFGAGSGSTIIANDPVIRNCQEVAWLSWSINELSSITVNNCDADVRITAAMISGGGTFGRGYIKMSGDVNINSQNLWDGEQEGLSTTSMIASMRGLTPTYAFFDINLTGDVFSLVTNKVSAMYGGIHITGGVYNTLGYLTRSLGWGSANANSRSGLIISGGAQIVDRSSSATDEYIKYQNSDANNVATYVYHDFSDCTIWTRNFRRLDGYTFTNIASLVELVKFPDLSKSTCYSLNCYRPKEIVQVKFNESLGLVGANTKIKVEPLNLRGLTAGGYITSNGQQIKVLQVVQNYVAGPLRSDILLEGDVRNQFTTGNSYLVMGA
ncbi:hypothetical protein [Vibrio cholerae]|uniref:hypothetical protein n=1 Tax=Vibrio cholerae TaxID=666 RepID=UPI00201B2FF8|nr:hypothetical protein [Vibrio cholerae]EJI2331319.1 hypothetical protein [Vibrio cholerae]ELK6276007.1 hypothetical protein [Vibrio cholerae]MCL5752796.1 hypothetical protein [Vibrio cholerae]